MSDNDKPFAHFQNSNYEIGPIVPIPEALHDKSRRLDLRREGADDERYPFPIPNSWYVISESRDLAPGEHKSLHAFGKDVVLFRTESGETRLVDAYCPHLGAHIGAGGKVEGEGIRCPFHGWRYDGESGKCDHIPYGGGKGGGKGSENSETTRIPAGAKLRTYPTLERNHMIWAWYHFEEKPPFFDVPDFAEFSDPEWLPYESFQYEIATCNQDFLEGEADLAHFKYVHGAPASESGELTVDGAYRKNTNGVESWGMGCLRIAMGDTIRIGMSLLPIDVGNLHVTFWMTTSRSMGEDAVKMIRKGFEAGVTQDMKVLENKKYLPKPLLLKSEKMIAELRRWALQFYSGYEA